MTRGQRAFWLGALMMGIIGAVVALSFSGCAPKPSAMANGGWQMAPFDAQELAEFLGSAVKTNQAAVTSPSTNRTIELPAFRYAPGIEDSTNYAWMVQGTTNLRDWFLVSGPPVFCASCTNATRWDTNSAPRMFYRALGVPR